MTFAALFRILGGWLAYALVTLAQAQTVVDMPTRPGGSQRLLVLPAPEPRAAVILLAGGHGGLQIANDGSFGWAGAIS